MVPTRDVKRYHCFRRICSEAESLVEEINEIFQARNPVKASLAIKQEMAT